ncbi:MAG: type III polyketide synthase [Planctomycetaceae bacterium]
MTAQIIGLGIASPPHSVARDRSVEFAQSLLYNPGDEARALPALYRMTSVQRRGSVLLTGEDSHVSEVQDFYPPAACTEQRGPSTKVRSDRYAEEAVPLAMRACRDAMVDAAIEPEAITHLVVVTCTGFYAPGVDIELIEQLGLDLETERVQVGFMGCHGAINGLRVARGLVAADPDAKVLLVSVELCSLHYQYGWEANRVVSNAIFADGSAAAVLTHAEHEGLPAVVATGSRLVPDSMEAMTWRIGDHGYEMTLSAEVPGLIEAKLSSFIVEWLGKQQLAIGDVGGWAVHPGGPRILRAVESSLELPPSALACSRAVLAEHGNMSSATMLFILRRFIDSGVERPWVMLGFGPGLEIEIALLR